MKFIRIIDIVSWIIGVSMIVVYWLLNGQWLVNDVMSVCVIVALMKLLKIRSLSVSVWLILSILFVEIGVGLFVHYYFKISYNNYVINFFQSPIMLVMPSITHELYRQCAWLPITSILFPGLMISYLRRFDKSRGTFLYQLIGLASFYCGSVLWMVIDKETVHSLPFAIISEPITVIIIGFYSFKRNEFKVLWKGNFHDEELCETQDGVIIKETEIIKTPSAYVDLTKSLRISEESDNSGVY